MQVEVGSIVEGKVSGITNFGAFVQLANGKIGLVHISEVADEYVKDVKAHLKENQSVRVKIISIDSNGKISLSIKKAQQEKQTAKSSRPIDIDWGREKHDNMTFEERLAKFLKDSDEKLQDLKKNFESKRGGGSYRKPVQFG